MKKKLISIFFCVSLICSMGGCQKAPSSLQEESKVEENMEDNDTQKYSSLFGASQQQLNVIDDNYRTYYEVFLYSFYDSNGDGIGDIRGLIEKLDYINDGDDNTDTDLGFNGIWLMPIMKSTTYHKYDVVDYYSIDEEYGTIEDFQDLIEECEKRGVKVIVDMPFNHTSAQHEWFRSALNSLKVEDCGQEECNVEGLCKKHNKYCD